MFKRFGVEKSEVRVKKAKGVVEKSWDWNVQENDLRLKSL